MGGFITLAAEPESLEDNFQKGALLGKKLALSLWYVRRCQARFEKKNVPEHLKVSHIWLRKFKKKLCLVIFFIHIIQLSFYSSEYSPIATS